MRTCSNDLCRKTEEETEFYSNNDLCKACILRLRSERLVGSRVHVIRAERAQTAILTLVREAQKDGTSFVYLLDSGKYYKIGFSSNVASRVKALQTAHASRYPIRVLAVVPGGKQLEQELHSRFRHCWRAREWFHRRQEIIAAFSLLPGSMVFLPEYMRPVNTSASRA